MGTQEVANRLAEKGLRVTPQRIAILEAVMQFDDHPTAEKIAEYIKEYHPNISRGTVYKVLDSFVENDLLKKVKTEGGIMRYDPLQASHHHLYCRETDRIQDYKDDTLDKMLHDYFEQKGIKGFKIQDIQLQITGTFKKHKHG